MTRYEKSRRRALALVRPERPVADAGRVARNTLALYFRMLAVMLVALFTSRVQLQALGVENYGLFQVAMATVGLFTFLSGSLSVASSRFLAVELGRGTRGRLKRVFSTVFLVHLVVGVGVVVLLETVGLLVLDTKLNIPAERLYAVRWAYQCGVFAAFLSITQIPYDAAIVAHERMSAFAWMSLYDAGAKLLIVCLLFVSPFDRLVVYATLYLVVSALSMAVYRLYCVRRFTEARLRRAFDRDLVRPIFGFVGWQALSSVALILVTQAFTLLNQRYFGPAVVAACAIGQTVNGAVSGFVGNFKAAVSPQVVKLFAARDFAASRELVVEAASVSTFLLLALGVPVVAYAPEILRFWLGEGVPAHADAFVRIFLAGALAQNYESLMFTVICADGRMKYNTLCDLVVYPVTFLGVWWGVRALGCPVTTAVGFVAMSAVMALVVKPVLLRVQAGYGLGDFLRMFAPSLVGLALCAAADWGLWRVLPNRAVWLVPNCALLVFANAALLCLVAPREVKARLRALAVRAFSRFHLV